MDSTETDDAALVGEVCHIIAQSAAGPRADSNIREEDIDKYANLILLCRIHHKQVDDQPNTFPPDVLREMKVQHENWIRENLPESTVEALQSKEIYASYIDEWSRRSDLEHWREWTFFLLGSGLPSLRTERFKEMKELRWWLFNRNWPCSLPELEGALHNFRLVLADLLGTFSQHAEEHGDMTWTKKFYQIEEWNPERYQELADKFDFHVDLVQDLTLELTRAGNYVGDHVRQFLDPTFRMADGILLVESGPNMKFQYTVYRPEYCNAERTISPYHGRESFLNDRFHRDIRFGQGVQGGGSADANGG